MIAALQKSRSAAPEGPGRDLGVGGGPVPESAPAQGPGDAIVEKFAAMDSKLDQILKLLGAGQQEAAPEMTAPEDTPNDDGN